MNRELFRYSAHNADVLDLGWPRKDHEAVEVAMSVIDEEEFGVSIRVEWLKLELSAGGSTTKSLIAALAIPLDDDSLLELTYALYRYLELDELPDPSSLLEDDFFDCEIPEETIRLTRAKYGI